MPLSRWLLLSCLIGLLLITGVAQAQSKYGGTNSQSLKTNGEGSYQQPLDPTLKSDQTGNYLQPWDPSLKPEQGVNGSFSGQAGQASPSGTNTSINKPGTNTKKGTPQCVGNQTLKLGSVGAAARNSEILSLNLGQRLDLIKNLRGNEGSLNSRGSGSSFLDGYLLKSLQDKKIGGKKEPKKEASQGDLPKKRLKKSMSSQ